MLSRYLFYLVRWQMSTPILAVCIAWLRPYGELRSTVVANLIGGLIFFWVDRCIFTARTKEPVWEVRESAPCSDCGRMARGYRLVTAGNYDKSRDPRPEFRCEACSSRKLQTLRLHGVATE